MSIIRRHVESERHRFKSQCRQRFTLKVLHLIFLGNEEELLFQSRFFSGADSVRNRNSRETDFFAVHCFGSDFFSSVTFRQKKFLGRLFRVEKPRFRNSFESIHSWISLDLNSSVICCIFCKGH